MRIKKFTAGTMREALLQIKRDLGNDAVILKTRRLPKKLFAPGGSDTIEVTAAIDADAASPAPVSPLKMSGPGVYGRTGLKGPPPKEPEPSKGGGETRNKLELVELKEEIRELKDLVRGVLRSGETEAAGGFSGGWAILYKRLIESEVKPEIASEVIADMRTKYTEGEQSIDRTFIQALHDGFPVGGPLTARDDGPLVVAFVGPTGSGKTTTLAKLAALYTLNKKMNVSLMTADTYRIAAIEQIRTFADIVRIGLHVVFGPDEVAGALASCENDDVVFVDTAGRSRKNARHMDDLRKLLESLKPHQTHLVLSATTKDSDLGETTERYRDLGITHLLFAKLDETARLGNILNTVKATGIPVSYFATGQSVPDDIELANTTRFVQRLWERTSV